MRDRKKQKKDCRRNKSQWEPPSLLPRHDAAEPSGCASTESDHEHDDGNDGGLQQQRVVGSDARIAMEAEEPVVFYHVFGWEQGTLNAHPVSFPDGGNQIERCQTHSNGGANSSADER